MAGRMAIKLRMKIWKTRKTFINLLQVKRKPPGKTQSGSDSSSFWSSENSRKKAQAGGNRGSSQEGDEALNAAFFGKGGNYKKDNLEVGMDRSLGEREIVGEKPKNSERENEILSEKSLGEVEKGKTCIGKGNWADILFKSPPNRNEISDVARDEFEMGLASTNISMEVEEPILSNRAYEVVKSINQNLSKEELGSTNPIHLEQPKSNLGKLQRNLPSLQEGRVIEGEFSREAVDDWVSSSDCEENFCNVERVFFPELESRRERIKRKALALGKSLGIRIEGNEEEAQGIRRRASSHLGLGGSAAVVRDNLQAWSKRDDAMLRRFAVSLNASLFSSLLVLKCLILAANGFAGFVDIIERDEWLFQSSGGGGISRNVEGFLRAMFLGPLEGIGVDHGESNGSKDDIETIFEAIWLDGLAIDELSRKSSFFAW
ncbi:hypothetical protein V6N12_007407 [Hibiscus sabdariffa]|uniref:Uncharacterized protein n=1 Tax=Hibiscus sabdariffa TaxID=183260 RepID=A0ABR2F1Q3_9ROSI